MRQSTSNSFVRVAIALALTVIVLTAVLGAGGVAAVSASTPGAATPTPEHTDASAAERSATTASPVVDAGVAAETETATLTLTVVDRTDDSITVALSTSAGDTMAYAADLTYDDEVVTVEAIDGADFDDPVTNVGDGRVRMTQSTLPAEAVDEPTFATITFAAAGDGETSLSFDDAGTTVETPDGEAAPLETRGLTLSVGDESGGGLVGGVPGDGSNDGSGAQTDEKDGTNTDDGSNGEISTEGQTSESDSEGDRFDDSPDRDDEAEDPVPGFTAFVAILALLGALVGSVALNRDTA